jgi:colanic acid biosynthesis protein WcaH
MNLIPDNLYKKILENIPVVCVDVYIRDVETGKFLLVKRNNEPEKGRYCCTGGRIQKGEDVFLAAQRKVEEELGCGVDKSRLILFGVTNTKFENSIYPGVSSHTINISFFYNVKNTDSLDIKLSDESNDSQWKIGEEVDVTNFVKMTIRELNKEIGNGGNFKSIYKNY